MKLIPTTALLTVLSLGTLTATTTRPASALPGYDMWTDTTVDTTNCQGYNSCWVNGWGEVTGTNDPYDPGSFVPNDSNWDVQVEMY